MLNALVGSHPELLDRDRGIVHLPVIRAAGVVGCEARLVTVKLRDVERRATIPGAILSLRRV